MLIVLGPLTLDQAGKRCLGGAQIVFTFADSLVDQFDCKGIAHPVFGACILPVNQCGKCLEHRFLRFSQL